MSLQEQRCERRRQRQRVDRRDHGRDRDRQRELPIELPGEAADEGQRHEHRNQHQRDGDDRSGHLAHRTVGCVSRRKSFLDIPFDVLDHDDGVIDHDADRQHQPEQAERIDREAEQIHHGEGADDRNRNGDQRNDRRAPCLQEDDDDEYDQRHRFQQRMHHGLDRGANELGRIVDDTEIDAVRHVLLDLRHDRANVVGNFERVRPRRLKHANADRRFVVEQRAQRVFGCAEFHAPDIAQAGDLAVLARLHDDIAELFLTGEPALRVDRQLQVDLRQAR